MSEQRVYQLPFYLFSRAAPLFSGTDFEEPFLDSVFQGLMMGHIFVDDPENPTAGLMCRTYDYFVAGNANSALRPFIQDAPIEADVFKEFYGYVALNTAWRNGLIDDNGFSVIPRLNFIYDAPAEPENLPHPPAPSPNLERGSIVPLDGALAERVDQELDETIGLFWSGYPNFGQHGFGVCLMIAGPKQGEIGACAFTCAVSQTMSSIGIVTAEKYRLKGYATLVAQAFFDESVRRGLTPTWDCDEWNTGSVMTARKLGLRERTPFTELGIGPYPRQKVPMSEGVWDSDMSDDGVVVWTKTGG